MKDFTSFSRIVLIAYIILYSIVSICYHFLDDYHRENELNAYRDYYNNCETLLDSISANDSIFINTFNSSDIYFKYRYSKQKIKSYNE